MTLKATIACALPEARRIASFLERDFGDDGAVVSLIEVDEATQAFSVEAYFEEGEVEALEAEIRDRLGGDVFGAPLCVEALPETDWIAAGLEYLKPVTAGRFVVHGSHDRSKVPSGRVTIEIDAGQAFGTGHHGTTAGCLAMLDKVMRRRRFENPLDLGTGSGVLAIAMAKVLRRPVLATDIDPVAVKVAEENAVLNGVGRLVRFRTAVGMRDRLVEASVPYDLIVANILAEPLIRLAPAISRSLQRGGTLLLSGLLPRQRERVVAAYSAQGVRLEEARIFSGWAVLLMRRP